MSEVRRFSRRRRLVMTFFSAIYVVLLMGATQGCTVGPDEPTTVGGTTERAEEPDGRLIGQPPSVAALKRVCEDAIESAATTVTGNSVDVEWTWPNTYVRDSVRCHTSRQSAIRIPKKSARIIAWVEIRPYADAERDADLPREERVDQCAALREILAYPGEEMEVDGPNPCTATQDDSRRGIVQIVSLCLHRASVITVGVTGFADHAEPSRPLPAAEARDVHDVLLRGVVKDFSEAE